MSSSLIRGKYIIGRVIDNDRAELIEDGAILQRDGKIAEIGAEGDGDRYKIGVPPRGAIYGGWSSSAVEHSY